MSFNSMAKAAVSRLAASASIVLLSSQIVQSEPNLYPGSHGLDEASYTLSPDKSLTEERFLGRHIILITDVSPSIKPDEYTHMMRGMAEALLSESVIDGFVNQGEVALSTIFFASSPAYTGTEFIVSHGRTPQQKRDNLRAQLSAYVDKNFWQMPNGDIETGIPVMPPLGLGPGTQIHKALELAVQIFDASNFKVEKRIVDLAGDGPDSFGVDVAEQNYSYQQMRELAVQFNATVNTLPITGFNPDGDVKGYYEKMVTTPAYTFKHKTPWSEEEVSGGETFLAENFQDFADAMRKKLIFELGYNEFNVTPAETPYQQNVMVASAEF